MTKTVTRWLAVNALILRFRTHGMLDKVTGAIIIRCPECGETILPEQEIQFDHTHADKLGGEHKYQNIRPIYKECHKAKSKRDVAALAKIDRLTGETKGRPKKPWAKGRKLQGRGFQKRAKP